ncbi:Eco57I restriction-modification methylase domain-containing protein [Mycobacteroides salmoniphilum]|uniref:Eco57I restriction-modification methylase domain-containing protein n=1 Tax=Mycobacteroides salmoniphilum TaxID=404941 RepID=UPI001064B886|nr:Eco57I restriction-modification methylase domain-containing protein [Mycobacteroides salmoniphilum]TDZ94280.1 Eco57I restriction-modification methylase [Mycobacteroides salmoniphilum]
MTAAMHRKLGNHVPDILDCLAQLSNDEVPTPPKEARAMLGLLPDEVWSNPNFKWLDPGCKSGVFLREAAVRLLEGLSEWEPDFVKRRDHIYRNMLFGSAITMMTGMISRRSLYCARAASSDLSVVKFDSPDGNLPYIPTRHAYVKERCTICGAPEALEREGRENYAYSFIHGTYPTEELKDVKFDVIVGNPPYQIDSEGNSRTRPVYQLFVQKAISMNPRYLVMITPSRWFTGGLGLDQFRAAMLADRRLAKMVDNPKLFDCFPGVEIKGGVSYFLWDREHKGDCQFSTRIGGETVSTLTRDLRHGKGVLIRSNAAEAILTKIEAKDESSIAPMLSSQKPFGFLSNFSDFHTKPTKGSVLLVKRDRMTAYVRPDQITHGHSMIAPIKVLTPEAGDGHGRVPAIVTGNPFVVSGNSVCTQTFLVAGRFETEVEGQRFAAYLRTKFVRYLVHQRKVSQHTTSDTYMFVPAIPMDRDWTDAALYKRYDLSAEDIAVIESQIKPMGATDVIEPGPEDDEE